MVGGKIIVVGRENNTGERKDTIGWKEIIVVEGKILLVGKENLSGIRRDTAVCKEIIEVERKDTTSFKGK